MTKVENTNSQRVVSFDDISPSSLTFSDQYKCARSTAGQVVAGLSWSVNNVSSTKQPTNEYQSSLYPMVCQLGAEVCKKYTEMFITSVTDPVQRQVYGANLNGVHNDGKLNRCITCKNINDRLKYQYSQFGQLLSLLYDRLLFISRRDVEKIQRYVNDETERHAFESLQVQCAEFCKYLRGDDDSVMSRWSTFVTNTRQKNNVLIQPRQEGRFHTYEHHNTQERRYNTQQNQEGRFHTYEHHNAQEGRGHAYEHRNTQQNRGRGRGNVN